MAGIALPLQPTVRLTDPEGRIIVGPPAGEKERAAVGLASGTDLPWKVQAISMNGGEAEAFGWKRQQMLITGLAAITVLVIAGFWLIGRAERLSETFMHNLLSWLHPGFSVFAGPPVDAGAALESQSRYLTRPALATDALEKLADLALLLSPGPTHSMSFASRIPNAGPYAVRSRCAPAHERLRSPPGTRGRQRITGLPDARMIRAGQIDRK